MGTSLAGMSPRCGFSSIHLQKIGTVHNRPKVVDSWFGETSRIAGSGHKERARDWPRNEAQLPAKPWRFRQLERPLVAGGALKRRSLRSLGVQESLMASCPHAGGA